jgi:hypothetical protein
MEIRMRLIGSLFFILCLASCSTFNRNEIYAQTISSWRWSHQAELIKVWGQPDQIVRLPNDNQVFIYTKDAFRNYPSPAITSKFGAAPIAISNKRAIIIPDPNNLPNNTTAFFLECKTLFEIDPEGIVVDARSQGNNCTANESFYLAHSNPHSKNPDTPPRTRMKSYEN